MKKNYLLVTLGLLSALTLAACGSGNDTSALKNNNNTEQKTTETTETTEKETDPTSDESDTEDSEKKSKETNSTTAESDSNETARKDTDTNKSAGDDANDADTSDEHSSDSDDLFQSYEEAKSESNYSMSQMKDIIYSGMDYNTYTEETMFEFMLSESYFNESDSVSFDVWIAQDGFLGVEVTPENGVGDMLEFNTMVEADEYGLTNYGAFQGFIPFCI